MTPHEQFERKFRRPKPGRTLIVGSRIYATRTDRRKLYSDVVGIDMLDGPGVDWMHDLETPLTVHENMRFAHVECRSVLEHSRRPWLLAANIERLMAPGATLDLSVPFVWKVHAYPSDYWRFTIEAVRELFPDIEWQALMYATERSLSKGDRKSEKAAIDGQVFLARSEVLGFGTKK
jgi:hypothetical protein